MKYEKTIPLKNGTTLRLRNGTAEDGAAMLDIFILNDSDYLIWSERSSFGQSAAGMLKAFDNEVSSEEFLREKGMQCSVYSMRKKAGEAFMISLSRGRSEKRLKFDV